MRVLLVVDDQKERAAVGVEQQAHRVQYFLARDLQVQTLIDGLHNGEHLLVERQLLERVARHRLRIMMIMMIVVMASGRLLALAAGGHVGARRGELEVHVSACVSRLVRLVLEVVMIVVMMMMKGRRRWRYDARQA